LVYWTGGLYFNKDEYNGVEGKNIWDYFFEPVSPYKIEDVYPEMAALNHVDKKQSVDIPSNIKIVDRLTQDVEGCPKNCWRDGYKENEVYLNNMSKECKEYVGGIIKKYVILKSIVREKIDKFYGKYMHSKHVLGVHRRADDGMLAGQGIDPNNKYFKAVDHYIKHHSDTKIFLATDMQKILNMFESRYGKRMLAYDALRSPTSRLWGMEHRSVERKLAKYRRTKIDKQIAGARWAEDAIIEAILLSKCDYFMRGYSNMSAIVPCFNPNIETMFIPQYKGGSPK
tara:strand:+ start:3441 stop:4292 length:852 start_codon:yes stop_codon:yes gene_type:complete